MSILRKMTILLLIPLLAGCGWLFGVAGRTDAEVPLRNETVLILPFSMPGRSYFQSTFGERFARYVQKALIAACPSATVMGPDDLPQSLKDEGSTSIQIGQVIEAEALYHIGRRLKADYVVVGEIHTIQSKKPKSFGVLQGRMTLSARIASVSEGKVAWRGDRLTFTYPKQVFGEDMPAELEEDENTLLRKLLAQAAVGLAEPFVGRERTLEEDLEKAFE
jgi:hypothetical protein